MNRNREIENWLDGALGQYTKVEPRAGLEGRLLGNMQAERKRITLQQRWLWFAAAIGLATIVVAVWLGEVRVGTSPTITIGTTTMPPQESAGVAKPPIYVQTGHDNAEPEPHKRTERGYRRHSPLDRPPKLDKFPSPAPLNEQEQMLARYVEDFPGKAAVVARSQTELQKQDEREMAAPWPNKSPDQLE